MWCKKCNIEVHDIQCPVCGNKTIANIPTEIHWCKSCKVPIVFDANQQNKGKCPVCYGKTEYMSTDIRPVFPEERLLLELLLKVKPNSLKKSSVWYSSNRYFIDGKAERVYGYSYRDEGTASTINKLEYHSKENTYEYFNKYIDTFCIANKSRLNYMIDEAAHYIVDVSREYDKDKIAIFVSGGKNSTVADDLVKKALSNSSIANVFEKTVLEMPTTNEYFEKYRKTHPHAIFLAIDSDEALREKNGGYSLINGGFIEKVSGLFGNNSVLAFHGNRERDGLSMIDRTNELFSDKKITTAFPLQYWNSVDIWLYLLSEKLDFNKAYRYGFFKVDRINVLNKYPRNNLLFRAYMPDVLKYLKKYTMNNEKHLEISEDSDVQILKKIITEYGNIWENYKVSKSLFMDFFPNNKILWHSLLACIEESIPKEISSHDMCTKTDYYRYIKKIKGTIGCTDDVATKVVSMWIAAIGRKIESDGKDDKSLDQQVIMGRVEPEIPVKNMSIDHLELSVRSYNCLKRAGINTVGDLISKTSEEKMGVRNLGRKSFEEVLEKLKELGIELNSDGNEYTEKNHPGRDKCDKLREIRKRIAEANGIEFKSAECHHTGPCLGTCPVCDEEIKYLDEQLQKKKARGEDVILNGLAINEIKEAGCNLESDHNENIVEMGMELPYDIKGNNHNEKNNDYEDEIPMGMDAPDDFFGGDDW